MYDIALLRELRVAHGLTQQQVADRLCIDRSTYAFYEAGRSRMDVETIIDLCRMYDIGICKFLGAPPQRFPEPAGRPGMQFFSFLAPDEQRLVIQLRACGESQRQAIIAAAEEICKLKE